MSNSATDRAVLPPTVWPARGRHTGPDSEEVIRRILRSRKETGALDDFAEPPVPEDPDRRVFEARWRVDDGAVTVRARLTLVSSLGRQAAGREWQLVAEAERPWDDAWPSPATMFWPDGDEAGDGGEAAWDYHPAVAGLRLRTVNPLPADDKDMRRDLRDAAKDAWCVNLVVHEAMTPDTLGRLPLVRRLPPGLAHRVVEHRATPQQFRAVNWAVRDLGVEVPRGGAVLLPPDPAPSGYDAQEFAVRSVFLDGSEPTELIAAVSRFAALPKPAPQGAEEALADLRDNWTLMTMEEQLDRQRRLVAQYSEALEAMTRSRDLYRESAERAHEALAALRDSPAPSASLPQTASALQQLTRVFKGLRPPKDSAGPAAMPEDETGKTDQ
ncbi:hypothetical protein EDD90_9744 [Streptomyces sp. Ag109_O5-1]|uniref:hypothetical protein n=1 Tax=Streptomyces sp. Ag109_O5-1 TaxID=1938851 RepID=UPI000F4F0B61|nr:hypothetical protein [Streptomyces sp. Ag109_O5-1]RPE46410.1 hypothetical protein EDD90_9744 [Streptomyces sp. Ag109_O5-1]